MQNRLSSITNTPFFENRKDFQSFLDWVRSLVNITIKPIPRELYDYKHREGEGILERDTYSDNKSPGYILYFPYDMTYVDVVYIINLVTEKLGLEDGFTSKRLNSTIKTQVLSILGKNTEIPHEEVIDIQNKYNISNQSITKIMNAPISLSVLRNIKKDKDSINTLKNSIKIGLDSIFVDMSKQTLGDFMTSFSKEEYEKLHTTVKEQNKLRNRFLKDELDDIEQNLWEKIGAHYKKIQLKEKNRDVLMENMACRIGMEVSRLPRQDSNIDSLKKLLEKKEAQCLMQCFLSHIFLSRLGIKHTTLKTGDHIQLIVYIGEKKYC